VKLRAWAVGPIGEGVYDVEFDQARPEFRPADGQHDAILSSGFVDLHIHGAFGADFMDADPGSTGRLCDGLREQGYEGLLATTVSSPAGAVQACLDALPDDPLVWGVHIEGPFLSPLHPGAQPSEALLEPAVALGDPAWRAILEDPRVRQVTLAPERQGGTDLVRWLVGRGVRVSLGHTDATLAQAREAREAGARGTTHTFNAMRGLHHREPGTVGFSLVTDDVQCELIYDRVHVAREAADALLRCKPASGVVAVSDCTRAHGSPPGSDVEMWGRQCVVAEDSVRLASNGALAGSTKTLLDCFQNLAADFGPGAAVRACSLNPREALERREPPGTWLVFGADLGLRDVLRSALPAERGWH
jgi:N-acetylglucosamine-6-phosphate deacetylase